MKHTYMSLKNCIASLCLEKSSAVFPRFRYVDGKARHDIEIFKQANSQFDVLQLLRWMLLEGNMPNSRQTQSVMRGRVIVLSSVLRHKMI